jgi:hypothetical protein
MSIPTSRQAYAFLRPLRGRSSTFIIKNRASNTAASRFILGCLAATKNRATILDTSCFHGVNVRELTEGLPKEFVQQSVLEDLPDGSHAADSLSAVLTAETPAIWIDDMNAVLQLLSSRGQRSGIHRLSTFFHLLSYHARVNNAMVLGMVYKAAFGTLPAGITRRSLPKVSDLQIVTELKKDEIVFRCHDLAAWPVEGFSAPLYLDAIT